MEAITIKADTRAVGTKAARAVRRDGNVPCVLYGHHVEPVAFQVPELALKPLIYTAELHVVHLEVEGQAWDCVMKDIVFHPITDRPIHADFQALQRGELVTLTVPVQFHGTPQGQKEGGDTQYIVHELEVRCLPKDIPSHIDVEVGHLNIGDAIHVGDLSVENLEFVASNDRTVVTVVPPRGGLGALDEEEEGGLDVDLEAGETEEETEA